MKSYPEQRRVFLSASAVGYYGSRGDEALDENAPAGSGFLADLTKKWEDAAKEAEPVARVVIGRFGVVLDRSGGALAKMLTPFRFGVGGPIGNGRQWMSWVDREDAVRFIEWAIERGGPRGAYNVTAPDPRTNREFSRALGRSLNRPAVMPVPAFALRMMFGEMADELLLSGQKVLPVHAQQEGFSFRYPTLEDSLRHVLAR
jgi:uncharacterized protein (TIGR01777 family)